LAEAVFFWSLSLGATSTGSSVSMTVTVSGRPLWSNFTAAELPGAHSETAS